MSRLLEAVNQARAGQSELAVSTLRQLVIHNEQDFYAWLWLAKCTPDLHEAFRAVDTALLLRPMHVQAQQIRQQLVAYRASSKRPYLPIITIGRL